MIPPAIQATWRQDFEVASYLVNPQKRLGLVGLLSLLQDAAWRHAEHLGHGYAVMLARGTGWVLTRQRLAMTGEWPAWGERVSIETWVRPMTGIFAQRELEIACSGRVVGACTTSWLPMDLRTRRPTQARISEDPAHYFDRDLGLEPPKLPPREGMPVLAEFAVRNSDLDLNGHVNNVRYAQWILDSLPLESHARHRLLGYEVNFLAETRAGETIAILGERAEGDPISLSFQGARAGEVKPAFTARLEVRPA